MLMTRIRHSEDVLSFGRLVLTTLSDGRQWFDFEVVAWARKRVLSVTPGEAYAHLSRLELDGLVARAGAFVRLNVTQPRPSRPVR
jgi:hypothetical protein